MDELVSRLSQGVHPVTVGGPRPSLQEFEQRINEMGYVFIKFTGTRGGTDLGVRVDREQRISARLISHRAKEWRMSRAASRSIMRKCAVWQILISARAREAGIWSF
ncbi:hypothetical protein [Ktedonosporobacter rubrisoli]|uniref:hypothetical protein n=1 Tax=Ktedonosporobacter rubrisoli TaxID=2509675 RepID=UPI001A92287C|nr:hypothetical protein [Ktedonosporobacter rubrisoli]